MEQKHEKFDQYSGFYRGRDQRSGHHRDGHCCPPKNYREKCRYKKLATLFFEPSTRTRLSFEAAMLGLGGSVLGFSDSNSSSASKGESMADTAKVLSCYADIMAIRHPREGAPYVASNNATVPVINAGDGGLNHPTQTLADILTISREMGRLDNLTIGLCGDLKYGRTVHSLIEAMSRYPGVKFVLISPPELKIPGFIRFNVLERYGIPYEEVLSLDEAMPKLDVLYMTRIQRERFDSPDEYERLKDCYILNPAKIAIAKETMCVLHPLPRVNEISVAVDNDPRAAYFRQVLNGKYIRTALILKLLEEAEKTPIRQTVDTGGYLTDRTCTNPKCICQVEQELPHLAKLTDPNANVYRCIYCEHKV